METEKKQKKKNNKGMKTLALVMMSFAALAMASGALVDYLSNEAEANVEVESPMELKVSTGDDWKEDNKVDLGSTYGGNTVSFMLQETNNADVKVTSDLVVKVYNEQGVDSCDEINSITFEETSPDEGSSVDISDSCEVGWEGDEKYLKFNTGETNRTEGKTYEYDIDTTFNQAAKGNYSATVQHVVA